MASAQKRLALTGEPQFWYQRKESYRWDEEYSITWIVFGIGDE
jgi:hypothetical protein